MRQLRDFDGRKIIALGEILPYQPVGILIGSSLPGRVWMGEIEVGLQCVADRFMGSEFGAVIRGQGVHPVFDRGQVSNQCLAHPRCLPVGQDINVHKVRGTLDYGQHNGGIVFPTHRVQLPITDAGSLLHQRRALLNGHPIGDRAPPHTSPTGLIAAYLPLAMAFCEYPSFKPLEIRYRCSLVRCVAFHKATPYIDSRKSRCYRISPFLHR